MFISEIFKNCLKAFVSIICRNENDLDDINKIFSIKILQ